MRDDLTLAATARRLQGAGLRWLPQIGDWCALLDAVHLSEHRVGLWCVVDADPMGWVDVRDSAGRWPSARIAATDALWLPTVGQLKTWLRAHGYTVSTMEGEKLAQDSQRPSAAPQTTRPAWANALQGSATTGKPGLTLTHRCIVSRSSSSPLPPFDGLTEVEAVAEAVYAVLASDVQAYRQG